MGKQLAFVALPLILTAHLNEAHANPQLQPWPPVADATEQAPEVPDVVAKFRLQGPGWQLGFTNDRGYALLGGAYLGIELFGWIGFEAGGGMALGSHEGFDGYAVGRAGLVPWLVDNRNPDGSGFSLQLDVLAAYEYVQVSAGADGGHYRQSNHTIGGHVGPDFNFRTSDNFGYMVRPLFTFGGVVASDPEGSREWGGLTLVEQTKWAMSVSVSAGVLF